MATSTSPIPTTIQLRDCPACLAPPQVFRACALGRDTWVIACPDCGLQMIGKRVEGLGLEGLNMLEVVKPGDDLHEMVERWNKLKAPEGGKEGGA